MQWGESIDRTGIIPLLQAIGHSWSTAHKTRLTSAISVCSQSFSRPRSAAFIPHLQPGSNPTSAHRKIPPLLTRHTSSPLHCLLDLLGPKSLRSPIVPMASRPFHPSIRRIHLSGPSRYPLPLPSPPRPSSSAARARG